MLQVHCVQLFYNVSDPGTEDILYEVRSVGRFTGIRLRKVADKTTIPNFRHLLERHGLGKVLLETMKEHLAEQGLKLREGTILDVSIIAAPSSTKNRSGERDAEIERTRKGKQWRCGMKLHVDVDDQTGLAHSLVTTAANVHDLRPAEQLLHGEEVGPGLMQGIRGSRGAKAVRVVRWAGTVPWEQCQGEKLAGDSLERLMEQCKSSVRAKVEHVFFYVKQMFDYCKTCYRGLAKNANRLALLPGFTNLLRSQSCRV